MISCKHLRLYVIQPILNGMSLYSPEAEEMLVATAAHESLGGYYLVQEDAQGQRVKNGAIGIYGMEPPTYWTVYNKYLTKIKQSPFGVIPTPEPDLMMTDLGYTTLIARLNYCRFAESFPLRNDIEGIWNYYRRYWNTVDGAATHDEFIENYERYTGLKA